MKLKMLRRTLQGPGVVGVGEPFTTNASHGRELIRKGYGVPWDGAEDQSGSLADLHVPELKDMAKALDIEGYANMRKEDLITSIEAARANGAPTA